MRHASPLKPKIASLPIIARSEDPPWVVPKNLKSSLRKFLSENGHRKRTSADESKRPDHPLDGQPYDLAKIKESVNAIVYILERDTQFFKKHASLEPPVKELVNKLMSVQLLTDSIHLRFNTFVASIGMRIKQASLTDIWAKKNKESAETFCVPPRPVVSRRRPYRVGDADLPFYRPLSGHIPS